MNARERGIRIRNTRPADFAQIIEISSEIYPVSSVWTREELASHLAVFPDGQFVATAPESGRVVGMAASLIVLWDDYDIDENWRDFTDGGMFTNHDPELGRTLYGAEVMVDHELRGRGIGTKLYHAREALVRRLGLHRIRAGARLSGYNLYHDRYTPREYVDRVLSGELRDPTLSFQLRQGFRVLAVVSGYLLDDPESRGYAAVVEWVNASKYDSSAGL